MFGPDARTAPKPVRPRLSAVLPWVSAAVFALASLAVFRIVAQHGAAAILEAVSTPPPAALAQAGACALGSFAVLSLADWLAVRTVTRVRLSLPRVALAAFIALSIGHVVGLAVLSSGALRYRLYSRLGLGLADVARMLLFSGTTVAAGLLGASLPAGLARPERVAAFADVPAGLVRACAWAAAAALLAWVVAAALVRRPLRVARFTFTLPSARVALMQIALGTLNYLFVAAVLHAFLRDTVELPLLEFASFYAAGHLLAILSHVPAGLGVLELVVLSAAPGPETLGALLLYRVVYFVVPFLIGAALYATLELRRLARSG